MWNGLDAAAVSEYLLALRQVVGYLHHQPPRRWPLADVTKRQVGPYVIDRELGVGTGGQAAAAHHQDTGARVCVKISSGAEGFVGTWLEGQWPAQCLAIYAHGTYPEAGETWYWVARELADETLHEYLARRTEKLDVAEALAIFETACNGVAALHAGHVYRWSAHPRNLFRVDAQWKLGDMSRSIIATSADDPRFVQLCRLEDCSTEERCEALEGLRSGPWYAHATLGLVARDPERERRMRLDDCSMLGGLLCDVLGRDKWELFDRALHAEPICSGRYVLTGNHKVDRRLSRIVNRCWLGDAGGVLSVAAGQSWTSGYSDALQLLADVRDAITGLLELDLKA